MKILGIKDLDRVPHAGTNVFGPQVAVVVLGNLLERQALTDEFQDVNDGNSRTRNAGLAEMQGRTDCYSLCHDPTHAYGSRVTGFL